MKCSGVFAVSVLPAYFKGSQVAEPPQIGFFAQLGIDSLGKLVLFLPYSRGMR